MTATHARAILWAQWRTILNYYPRSSKGGVLFGIAVSGLWYGLWTLLALFLFDLFSDPSDRELYRTVLPSGLLLVFLYWQLIPVLLASSGITLEAKKLRVYPARHGELFGIELLLRVSTCLEMLILLAGAGVGIIVNPSLPWWSALAFAPFTAFNLCLAAGAREVLSRIFARKRIREVAVLMIVLVAALPQLVIATGLGGNVRQALMSSSLGLWPWSATARLASGDFSIAALAVLLGWTAIAYSFGRWQFERGLRFDADESRATRTPARSGARTWTDRLSSWPSALFPDPLAALIEKEIRFLSRAPRFRLVFTMGFTFGLIVWLPFTLRGGRADTALGENYLAVVAVYALLLLGDVCFWNMFGFDRIAAQVYFVTPVPFRTVLFAKNISALFFVLVEITALMLVCTALRVPVTGSKVIEAFLVTLVMSAYLCAIGNLTSTRSPRAINPARSMRSGSTGGVQALLAFVYPLAGFPVLLAYGARYAFDSEIGFYVVLAFAAGIGACVYWVSMGSSIAAARERREQIIAALSKGEGVMQV